MAIVGRRREVEAPGELLEHEARRVGAEAVGVGDADAVSLEDLDHAHLAFEGARVAVPLAAGAAPIEGEDLAARSLELEEAGRPPAGLRLPGDDAAPELALGPLEGPAPARRERRARLSDNSTLASAPKPRSSSLGPIRDGCAIGCAALFHARTERAERYSARAFDRRIRTDRSRRSKANSQDPDAAIRGSDDGHVLGRSGPTGQSARPASECVHGNRGLDREGAISDERRRRASGRRTAQVDLPLANRLSRDGDRPGRDRLSRLRRGPDLRRGAAHRWSPSASTRSSRRSRAAASAAWAARA